MSTNTTKTSLALWAASAGMAGLSLYATGCQLSDLVKVEVPPHVQTTTGADPTVTLTDTGRIRETYLVKAEAALAEFDANIEKGYETFGFLSTVAESGMGMAQESGPLFPGGMLITGLLSTLGAYFMKRPGEEQRVAKEKQDSYNAGIARGEAKAQTLVQRVESVARAPSAEARERALVTILNDMIERGEISIFDQEEEEQDERSSVSAEARVAPSDGFGFNQILSEARDTDDRVEARRQGYWSEGEEEDTRRSSR